MTADEVDAVLVKLIMAYDFDDGLAETYAERMRTLTDAAVAMKTADYFIDSWDGMGKPRWKDYRAQYERFYARAEEKRQEDLRELESGGRLAGMISPKEGRQIAAAAYAKQYKRKPPANIFDLPDPEFVPTAQPEEIERALDVIRGGYDHEGMTFSKYTDVLAAFDGHHLTARAAVRALEESRRLVHRPDGTLVLLKIRTIGSDER